MPFSNQGPFPGTLDVRYTKMSADSGERDCRERGTVMMKQVRPGLFERVDTPKRAQFTGRFVVVKRMDADRAAPDQADKPCESVSLQREASGD